MILPIYVYGSQVLKKIAVDIPKDYSDLDILINNMFETMHFSEGVGLAAPQIGKSIRLFVIDAAPMAEDEPSMKDFKKVFINAKIIEEKGNEWYYNEGCLSVPNIREDIKRKSRVNITYYDENFIFHNEWFDGIKARIIQHEYDHLEAILLVDRLSQLKKRLLKRKLTDISNGNVDVKYKIIYPNK